MYVGPETMMPVASVLAAITGLAMLFWRRTVGILRAGARMLSRGMSRLLGRAS